MNILHLFWIVPSAAVFGYVLCALLVSNEEDDP